MEIWDKTRRPCDDRYRDWNYVATNHELLEPSEARRGKKRFSPKSLQ